MLDTEHLDPFDPQPGLDAAVADPPPAPDAQDDEDGIYGTFIVDESEFAISVDAIQEVVNEPAQFTSVPLSPDYLIGLFNLRGVVIPVVDLRKIFDTQPPKDIKSDRKVAIVEHGDNCFGLLVDRTGDVFNARDAERTLFKRVQGNPRETIIGGVFKLDDGSRLVQILDPYELLNLERLPRVTGALRSALSRRKRGRRNQCISFRVGESVCAFDMTSVREIVELKQIDNTALASEFTLGAIELRGSTVPVIDFRVFLGQRTTDTAEEMIAKGAKLIIMKIGDNLISLLVDAIENIISFYNDDLLPFPGVGQHRSEVFKGCLCDDDDKMVLLLDHTVLIGDEELSQVTRGHSALFHEKDEAARTAKTQQSSRRTLITFDVGGRFALDIEDVNEVISFPETVLTPPSVPDFIAGMVNLRGELIPIINLRVVYALPVLDPSTTKLLVFTRKTKKYAIMVDAVDSIIIASDQNSNLLPRLSEGSTSSEISNDVREAILFNDAESQDEALMVFDLDAVVSRISKLASIQTVQDVA